MCYFNHFLLTIPNPHSNNLQRSDALIGSQEMTSMRTSNYNTNMQNEFICKNQKKQKVVKVTHGENPLELVQNLFRFHVGCSLCLLVSQQWNMYLRGRNTRLSLHLVDQVCQVFQMETGFKTAFCIIPCCDLMGEN